MKESAAEWLRAAQEDLAVIESIINNLIATGAASFHAQQCVEKSLKAILEQVGGDVPRVHDLETLFGKTREILPIEYEESTVDALNTLYIGSRYPGSIGLLPHGRPTLEDVERFYIFARTIFEQVGAFLSKCD
jgi:HEPN domain-containing protein